MTPAPSFFFRASRVALLALGVLLAYAFLPAVGTALLLLFAALLLGILLHGLAEAVEQKTGMGHGWALGLVIVLILLLLALIGWLIGPSIAEQVRLAADRAPGLVDRMQTRLEDVGFSMSQLSGLGRQALGGVQTFFGTVLGALVNTFIVLFGGVFLAATPSPYKTGIVKLFPRRHQERVREVLRAEGHALRRWLIGRGISMLVLGVFTGVGLMLFGVPLALTLGVLAAVSSFVPYIGGFVWLLVGMGAALATGDTQDVYVVAGVYLAAQAIESNVLLPLVQRRTTDILPLVLIGAQLMLGTLAGALGVLVATPLAVAVVVLVQMGYVQSVLGNRIHVLGAGSRDDDGSDGPPPDEDPLETGKSD